MSIIFASLIIELQWHLELNKRDLRKMTSSLYAGKM